MSQNFLYNFSSEDKKYVYQDKYLMSDLITIFLVYQGLKPSCLTNTFIEGTFTDETNKNENIYRREIVKKYVDILNTDNNVLDNSIVNKTIFIWNKNEFNFEESTSIFTKIITNDNKIIIKYNPFNMDQINKLSEMLGYYTRDYFGSEDHSNKMKKRELYAINIIETKMNLEIYSEVIDPEKKICAIQFYKNKIKKINKKMREYGLEFNYFISAK